MVTFRDCFWKFRWASPSVIYGSPPPPQGQDCLLGRSGDIPRKLAKLCCVKLLFTHAKHISVVCFVHMFTFSFLNWFSLLLWKLVERGGGTGFSNSPPCSANPVNGRKWMNKQQEKGKGTCNLLWNKQVYRVGWVWLHNIHMKNFKNCYDKRPIWFGKTAASKSSWSPNWYFNDI